MNSSASDLQIEIFPDPAFVDEDVSICVHGAQPGEIVRISATVSDDAERVWRAEAEFRADDRGCVEVANQESLGGTYRGVAAMGLFWSMTVREEVQGMHSGFSKANTAAQSVVIEAEQENGQRLGLARMQRVFFAPGIEIRDLKIDSGKGDGAESTIGRLFLPERGSDSERLPTVIVLGGSGGGFDVDKAAVLARHGFATLALAYFGIPPLPSWLNRIPLEYFQSAIAWLEALAEVDARRIGVLGVSRGAELSLLLGTVLPELRAIAAYAPSSVVWAAGGPDGETGELVPTWTWKEGAIPFAPLPLRGFMLRSAIPVMGFRRPVMFRNLFRAGLRAVRGREDVLVPVERIGAPLLLISGGDDHLWPAAEMCEAIVARRKRLGAAATTEHVNYPRAGHNLRYPHLPTSLRHGRNRHLRGARFSMGGTTEADAEAQQDAWRRTIQFFRTKLS